MKKVLDTAIFIYLYFTGRIKEKLREKCITVKEKLLHRKDNKELKEPFLLERE